MYKYLFFIICFLFLSGCAKNEQMAQSNEKWSLAEPKIHLQNKNIAKWLFIEDLVFQTRKDNLIEVNAMFQNTSNSNKKVAYKIDWYDENDFIVNTILSKWIVVEIEQRRALVIKGIAPSTKVKNFKIKIQEPTKDDGYRNTPNNRIYQGN